MKFFDKPLNRKHRQRGFSLIEVVVALAVVAVSLGAVIHAVGAAANHEAIIAEQTLARWVAMNQLAKLKLERAFPKVGESKGDDEMAKAQWVWVQKTIATEDENVMRVEMSVWRKGHEKEDASAMLVGFLTR